MHEDREAAEGVIEVRGVSVRRGATTILDGVDWQVRLGEHWVILGANGSGKTSLLNVLAGYLTPSEGVVRVCGRTYGEFPWPELRKLLGIVSGSLANQFQGDNRAADVVASGSQAIINPWLDAPAADAERATALLADAGLAGLETREWRHLSQGERQRVLICRALMAELRVLILDEPCAGLDPVARERFLGFVHTLAKRPGSPAIVLVTHHVEEILPSFTHALILGRGRVHASGLIRDSVTREALSTAFEHPVRPVCESGRWRLEIG